MTYDLFTSCLGHILLKSDEVPVLRIVLNALQGNAVIRFIESITLAPLIELMRPKLTCLFGNCPLTPQSTLGLALNS